MSTENPRPRTINNVAAPPRSENGRDTHAASSTVGDASGVVPAGIIADGGGLRHNAGKVQVELIPPEWTWGLAMVLTRGAAKYAPRNWERGMKWSFLIGCIARHVTKFICGERYDPETGCHHMAMAAWNCLALMTYDIRAIGENDMVGKLEWIERVATDPGAALQKIIDAKLPPR